MKKKSQHKASPNNSRNHYTLKDRLPVTDLDKNWLQKHGRWLRLRRPTDAEYPLLDQEINRVIVHKNWGVIMAFNDPHDREFLDLLGKISPYSYQGKNRKQHIVIDLALATICDHATVHNELVNPALALVQGFDLYESLGGSYV